MPSAERLLNYSSANIPPQEWRAPSIVPVKKEEKKDFYGFFPQGGKVDMPTVKEKAVDSPVSLQDHIDYFDTSFQKEGLPQDWWRLNGKVGFSIKGQMEMLKDTSDDSVTEWTQQTKQDIVGFNLEYLSKHLVYPCKYVMHPDYPGQLVDPLYGYKDMDAVVSEQERGGSVKKSLQEIKRFFLDPNTRDGAVAVMPSPKGESGLKTDNGKDISYPDSYFFVLKKENGVVTNYTIKTDFDFDRKKEVQKVIQILTKREVPQNASVADCVRMLAFYNPKDGEPKVEVNDIVRVLEDVRKRENGKTFAFGNQTFKSIYEDIEQGEKLYQFNDEAQKIIKDFETFCAEKGHSKSELEKALGATILRLSKYMLFDKDAVEKALSDKINNQTTVQEPTYGQVLSAVAEIPGCAGGGEDSYVLIGGAFGGPRWGIIDSDEYGPLKFVCPNRSCNQVLTRPLGGYVEFCRFCSMAMKRCGEEKSEIAMTA